MQELSMIESSMFAKKNLAFSSSYPAMT